MLCRVPVPRRLDASVSSAGGSTYVTDVCSLFLRHRIDPWLPTATWVRCLGSLGIAATTARTTLHRMAKAGFLDNRERGYAMSDAWRELMEAVQDVEQEAGEERWLLVTFTVPEERRDARHQLRTVLARLGLGSLGGGVWIGALSKEPQVRELLARLDLDQYVEVFAADHLGPRDTADIARRCWDVEGLAKEYADLAADANRATRGEVGDEAAFVQVVTFANRRRLLRERDPGLPESALPPGWRVEDAEAAVMHVLEIRRSGAERWLRC